MGYRFAGIAIVALLAIMTMATGSEVTAFQAYTARYTAGQLVQFHVEATLSGVTVTIAG